MNLTVIQVYERLKPGTADPSTYRLPRQVAVVKTSRRKIYVVPDGPNAVRVVEGEAQFLKMFSPDYVAPTRSDATGI